MQFNLLAISDAMLAANIAICVCSFLLILVASYHALQDVKMEGKGIVAVCASLLGVVGMSSMGQGVLNFVGLTYVAFAIAMITVMLLATWVKFAEGRVNLRRAVDFLRRKWANRNNRKHGSDAEPKTLPKGSQPLHTVIDDLLDQLDKKKVGIEELQEAKTKRRPKQASSKSKDQTRSAIESGSTALEKTASVGNDTPSPPEELTLELDSKAPGRIFSNPELQNVFQSFDSVQIEANADRFTVVMDRKARTTNRKPKRKATK